MPGTAHQAAVEVSLVAYALLTVFHLALYRRQYFDQPYATSTAEVLETYLGSSRLLGEWLRGHRRWGDDPYYYANPTALPFLSLWYPPHRFQAYLGSFRSLNGAFRLLTTTMALHSWLGSMMLYTLLTRWTALSPWPAGCAALAISHLSSSQKPTPCTVYTMSWIPAYLLSMANHCWWGAGISLGMMLSAGYWPMVVVFGGLGCLAWWVPLF